MSGHWHKRQRGMTLPLTAVFIVVLFAAAALAIDLGVLYTARTSAQRVADAAALAGAFTFLNPTALQPDTAKNAAIGMAAQNKVLGQTVTLTSADVVIDQADRRVTVTVPRTGSNGIGTYFARVLGYQKLNISARASAEASSRATGTHCIKPFFLPNTVLSSNPAGACPNEVIFTAQNQLSTFVQSKWGTALNLRPVSPSDALSPSQFYSLQLGGSGAATYQCAIGQCLNSCFADFSTVHCGDDFPLQTGNMEGPTRQGISELIGSNPDLWRAVGQYETFAGDLMDDSKSVITVPVWDDCTQPISSGYHGQALNVIGFLALFVDGVQGQSVKAHLVNAAACSTQAGSGPGRATGPMAIPIRLVQPQ